MLFLRECEEITIVCKDTLRQYEVTIEYRVGQDEK